MIIKRYNQHIFSTCLLNCYKHRNQFTWRSVTSTHTCKANNCVLLRWQSDSERIQYFNCTSFCTSGKQIQFDIYCLRLW